MARFLARDQLNEIGKNKSHQLYAFTMKIPVINGSFVEVQQDMENNFEATFVECKNGHHRPPCHGINTIIYSSECVTLYEWREAFVRLPQSDVNFILSKIKIPIACQCRLIRKLQPFARRLVKYLAQ
ncbi:hypothetical protein DICVIV_06919 [Dictyocaulus viviparus]|uniref:Uncharacterized protein n=1 Tax=Dictyocaulus viviparus TaxID=29172 RepID=A0A0D8XTA0_DICVI|nr:hypothetical protein DICVIV_06919 [Dictyocaulus viviparus]